MIMAVEIPADEAVAAAEGWLEFVRGGEMITAWRRTHPECKQLLLTTWLETHPVIADALSDPGVLYSLKGDNNAGRTAIDAFNSWAFAQITVWMEEFEDWTWVPRSQLLTVDREVAYLMGSAASDALATGQRPEVVDDLIGLVMERAPDGWLFCGLCKPKPTT